MILMADLDFDVLVAWAQAADECASDVAAMVQESVDRVITASPAYDDATAGVVDFFNKIGGPVFEEQFNKAAEQLREVGIDLSTWVKTARKIDQDSAEVFNSVVSDDLNGSATRSSSATVEPADNINTNNNIAATG